MEKNRNKKYNLFFKALLITYMVFFILILLASSIYAQSSLRIGITCPLKMDNEYYGGLDKFAVHYLKTYFNKINGIEALENYDVNNLFQSKFNGQGIDEIYSGFMSQIKLYMRFDLLLVSEISSTKKNGKQYIKFRFRLLDHSAEVVTKFKITISDKTSTIKYLNQSIEFIIKKIVKNYSEYHIKIDEKLLGKMISNEIIDTNFSLSYFYIEDKDTKELMLNEGKFINKFHNYNFSNEDISKAFLKRYTELKVYSKALSFGLGLIKETSESESVEVFTKTAKELYEVKLYKATIDILNAVIIYKKLKDPIVEFKVSLEMGKALIERKNFLDAEPYIIVSEDISKTYGYFPYLLESLNLYAYLYAKFGDWEKMGKSLRFLRKKVEKVDSKLWTADFYHYEAKTYIFMADMDKALELVKQAEDLYKELGEYRKLVKNYIVKAQIYKEKMEYEDANIEIRNAMKCAVENYDYISIKQINDMMLEIYELSNEKAYIKKDEKRFINLYEENLRKIHDRAFLRSIVHLYIYLKAYDKAIETIENSISISEELESSYYLYEDYLLLGNIYLLNQENDLAFLQYANSLKYSEQTKSSIYQFYCLIKLAKVFKIKGNVDKAISTYKAIAESGQIYGILTLVEEAYYQLSLIYKEKNDIDKYIEYSRKALGIGKKLASFRVDIYNEPLKNNG